MDSSDPTALEFLDQFEPDGAGFLYRTEAGVEPVHVTAAERQAFLAEFECHAGSLKWILIGGVVASTVFMLADMSILHVPQGFSFVLGAYAASFVAYFLVSQRLKRAPERALRDRIPAGMRLSWFQRYQRSIAARSWRDLLSSGLFLTVMFGFNMRGHDLNDGWNRLWLAVGVILYTLFGFSVIQKLRTTLGKHPG
jgi:hypothetical protein